MADLENRNYIHWDAEGVEKVPEGEAEHIQAVADMINDAQRRQFNHCRHVFGGTPNSEHIPGATT